MKILNTGRYSSRAIFSWKRLLMLLFIVTIAGFVVFALDDPNDEAQVNTSPFEFTDCYTYEYEAYEQESVHSNTYEYTEHEQGHLDYDAHENIGRDAEHLGYDTYVFTDYEHEYYSYYQYEPITLRDLGDYIEFAPFSNIDINITGKTISEIQTEINGAFIASVPGNTITVTGLNHNADATINLNIPAGVRVYWYAELIGDTGFIPTGGEHFHVIDGIGHMRRNDIAMLRVRDSGTLIIRDGAIIRQHGQGAAIIIDSRANINIGPVDIDHPITGTNPVVYIEGGLVESTATNTLGAYENRRSSCAIFIRSHNPSQHATLNISGGVVSATGLRGKAIVTDTEGEPVILNISGGLITAGLPGAGTGTNPGANATAISLGTSTTTITGGHIWSSNRTITGRVNRSIVFIDYDEVHYDKGSGDLYTFDELLDARVVRDVPGTANNIFANGIAFFPPASRGIVVMRGRDPVNYASNSDNQLRVVPAGLDLPAYARANWQSFPHSGLPLFPSNATPALGSAIVNFRRNVPGFVGIETQGRWVMPRHIITITKEPNPEESHFRVGHISGSIESEVTTTWRGTIYYQWFQVPDGNLANTLIPIGTEGVFNQAALAPERLQNVSMTIPTNLPVGRHYFIVRYRGYNTIHENNEVYSQLAVVIVWDTDFSFDFIKVFGTEGYIEDRPPLPGARFYLYQQEWSEEDNEYKWVPLLNEANTQVYAISGSDGRVSLDLSNIFHSGYYRIREVAPQHFYTPPGYWVFEVIVNPLTNIRWITWTPERVLGPTEDILSPLTPEFKLRDIWIPGFDYEGQGDYYPIYFLSNLPKRINFRFHKTDYRIYGNPQPGWNEIDTFLLPGAQFRLFAYDGPGTPSDEELVHAETMVPNGNWVQVWAGTSENIASNYMNIALETRFSYFQLVETLAPSGFMTPMGQWRIAISDEPPVNETGWYSLEDDFYVRITNIGDTLLFIRRPNGVWYVGNRLDIELPLTGGAGSFVSLYSTLGIIAIIMGFGSLVYLKRGKISTI